MTRGVPGRRVRVGVAGARARRSTGAGPTGTTSAERSGRTPHNTTTAKAVTPATTAVEST